MVSRSSRVLGRPVPRLHLRRALGISGRSEEKGIIAGGRGVVGEKPSRWADISIANIKSENILKRVYFIFNIQLESGCLQYFSLLWKSFRRDKLGNNRPRWALASFYYNTLFGTCLCAVEFSSQTDLDFELNRMLRSFVKKTVYFTL